MVLYYVQVYDRNFEPMKANLQYLVSLVVKDFSAVFLYLLKIFPHMITDFILFLKLSHSFLNFQILVAVFILNVLLPPSI